MMSSYIKMFGRRSPLVESKEPKKTIKKASPAPKKAPKKVEEKAQEKISAPKKVAAPKQDKPATPIKVEASAVSKNEEKKGSACKLKARLQKMTLVKVKDRQNDLKWFHIDATGKTLGRLASEIAKILRGKHRVDYTANVQGDGVVVTNVEKIHVSGNKEAAKNYYSHSLYIGGLKTVPYRTMMARHPERILRLAVLGMIPRNRMRNQVHERRLRFFKGPKHDMVAQAPIDVVSV